MHRCSYTLSHAAVLHALLPADALQLSCCQASCQCAPSACKTSQTGISHGIKPSLLLVIPPYADCRAHLHQIRLLPAYFLHASGPALHLCRHPHHRLGLGRAVSLPDTTADAAATYAMLPHMCACAAPTSVLALLNANLVVSINVVNVNAIMHGAGCLRLRFTVAGTCRGILCPNAEQALTRAQHAWDLHSGWQWRGSASDRLYPGQHSGSAAGAAPQVSAPSPDVQARVRTSQSLSLRCKT